jgi:hypothetical protein
MENEELITSNYGNLSFYSDILIDDKAKVQFIKQCVSLVRKCSEYSRYRKFLLDNLNMDKCSILSNLTNEESSAAGLELHHAPLTLYDIVELILGQMEYNEERITTFAIANKVMVYHWRGLIGLVPLTETIHEAVHSGQIIVDPRSIFGNWQQLIDENRNGLTEHFVEKLKAIVNQWNSDEWKEKNKEALKLDFQLHNLIAPTKELLLTRFSE